ncbi:3-deoxy-D-manno-octulosonic acid transferase [Roseinatronobacter alkalisoli]|uniref:3-deoxy-D-manno-octulosonic acid transferase n=1 Tax=Roseinatronobacter alkalisoli TaxID=3028235 RepID=A0ABT5TC01_9RHOB|nr:glycosyltransferase N-terminal domain-containing protein [Roseinatronobacter sp. HJB301]MDD7972658.1 glycosyltransferase N-terminal domain-containing protein [Roseinatronobacter sp. HJB301]
MTHGDTAMRKPALVSLYLALSRLSPPLWALALNARARKGKEDRARLAEKWGHASLPRPAGPLIWMHGVSVGESVALLTLIARLRDARPDTTILLTTITQASAQALSKRALPDGVIHQYMPVDTPAAVRRFMDHWRPDLTAIAEADLWPRILMAAKARGCPMILLNTHVTPRRYRRRRRAPAANGWLMNLFDEIHVQDEKSHALFRDLGAPMDKLQVTGVLKAASAPLPDDQAERAKLETAIGARPRWLAASTRAVEEDQLFDAHARALERKPDLLMIIAPRQMRDADKTEALAQERFGKDKVARRSRGDAITPITQVYIADSIGEMGLWYRLAPVAYTGQSLPLPDKILGGKNPFEAVALDCMVLHGPTVANFREAYDRLHAEGGALLVENADQMAQAVCDAQSPEFRAPFIAGAHRVQRQNMQPLEKALSSILGMLPAAT